MTRVLFVCLGNICRSPAAEAVFCALISKEGLAESFKVDSAGTGAYHAGEPADPRMRQHGSRRGYDLTSIARQLAPEDFEHFDYVVTMDESNFHNALAISRQCSQKKASLVRMRDYCEHFNIDGVPDPYYGGDDGFIHVFDILEDACAGLLRALT